MFPMLPIPTYAVLQYQVELYARPKTSTRQVRESRVESRSRALTSSAARLVGFLARETGIPASWRPQRRLVRWGGYGCV